MRLPLKHILVVQPFGKTPFAKEHPNFYKNGSHNGIDFRSRAGNRAYACFDGVANTNVANSYGKAVTITSGTLRAYYWHLEDQLIGNDTLVKAGQLVAITGNTGKYTTGEHLHFGLARLNSDGTIKEWINPADFFDALHDGTPIKNKDWQRSNAYHRYGKKANYLAEFFMKFTPIKISNTWVESGKWIQKRIVKLGLPRLNDDQYNALIYGSWSFDDVINSATFTNCLYLTKAEVLSGKKPFTS